MERVWDYPRPPAVEPCARRVRVEIGVDRPDSPPVAWAYRSPSPGYEQLKNYVAFYPGRVDAAYLGEERVEAQAGDFYGGWITSDLEGPFKGPPGTQGW